MISIKHITAGLLHASLVCAHADTTPPVYYQPVGERKPATRESEVVVYGGTSAGFIAAIQAARMGRKPMLIMKAQRIAVATFETGLTIKAAMFIDTTDEGAPMAAANIFYTVWREPHGTNNASLAGKWQGSF